MVKEKWLNEEILSGTETVLFVDDEDFVIDIGQKILNTLGYKVLLANGGKEAIEVYQNNQNKIDLIILDMIMPGTDGGEVFNAIREINPDKKVLLTSGYDLNGQAKSILERGCDGFIQKPFDLKKLSMKMREILDKE
jgi:CheY-like chemotaxis protein